MATPVLLLLLLALAPTLLAQSEAGIGGLRNCGGDTLSAFFANLVSIPCDYTRIDNCCEVHDRCYESPYHTQEQCDSAFCACLDNIPSNLYCGLLAQKGLCLATRVFGHNFHWSSQCASTANDTDDENGTMTNCVLSGSLEEYEWQQRNAVFGI